MIQTLMLKFLGPLFILGSMYRSFEDNLIDIGRINTIIHTPASVIEGKKEIGEIRGEIELKHVNFKYTKEGHTNTIEDINFKVQPGQFVALVGRSGAGKTTILNLIFRLYEPQSGSILLDGTDISELTFDFRKQISFVSQNAYLFNGTVMENLTFGSTNYSEE